MISNVQTVVQFQAYQGQILSSSRMVYKKGEGSRGMKKKSYLQKYTLLNATYQIQELAYL